MQTTILTQTGSIWRTLGLLVMIVAALILVPCAADAAVPVVETDYTFNANPAGSPGANITLTKPSGWAVGDLFLVFVSSDSDQGPEWKTKTGWTRLINCGSSTTNTVTGIYYRIADGNVTYEGSTETFSQTNTDDLMGYWIRISGIDTNTPIHTTTSCQQQTTTTPDIAGFNTTNDDVLAMWFLSFDGADFRDGGGVATGSGWPTDFIDGHTPSGDGTDIGGGWSQKNMASQGATGTVEVDADHSDGASFVQIGFNPAVADTTAPTPTTMTFATAPDDVSTASIDMTATTASDPSTPVEYLFTSDNTDCGADAGTGGANRAWGTGLSYTNSGLQVNKCYGYTVTARDSVPNTGTASSRLEAYTRAAVPGTPTLSGATSSTLDLTNAENGNPAANPTTSFAVQVVTTSDATWLNKWVDGSGNPSATAVWLTDAQLDGLTLQGLTASTTYGVKVKARNGNSDETALSAEGQGATSAANAAPGTPTLSETPAFTNMDTADTTPVLGNFSATDPDSDAIEYEIQWDVDYSFGTPVTQNSSGFASNGFTAATFASGASISYTVQGGEALTNGQTYWWRVRARDPSGANTWSSYSATRSITIDTSITLDQWSQTTTEQFDSANGNTLTDTQATGNGVKLLGW